MVNPAGSAIYECRVMHHRLAPKVHRFEYRVFYLWLDLDELGELDRALPLFSRNRWNLFSFRDGDHFADDGRDVKTKLLAWLDSRAFDTSRIARVKLLTFPRVLGYIFNPVCFFYCFDAAGNPVCAVAEVTNTYHEKKPYLLGEVDEGGRLRLLTPKHFYVSPFSDLGLVFDFKLRVPDERLEIHIDDREGDARVLLTSLTGTRRALGSAGLLACAIKYPLLTLRVIFLIHWHAFRLWLKRLPVRSKAANPELQRDLHRAHQSIASKPRSEAH
jgi:uncharacterized protein